MQSAIKSGFDQDVHNCSLLSVMGLSMTDMGAGSFQHLSSILYVSKSTSSGSFLASARQSSHHTTGTPCKLTFFCSCLPGPQVFKHNNNLNEIMKEIHSNAVGRTVLLLKHQRELNWTEWEKNWKEEQGKGGKEGSQKRLNLHTHTHTHREGGEQRGQPAWGWI